MSNKILVVDDDDALREMVGLVLNAAGYETVFAADGLSAVEVFKNENPDLVLLDTGSPEVGIGQHRHPVEDQQREGREPSAQSQRQQYGEHQFREGAGIGGEFRR